MTSLMLTVALMCLVFVDSNDLAGNNHEFSRLTEFIKTVVIKTKFIELFLEETHNDSIESH